MPSIVFVLPGGAERRVSVAAGTFTDLAGNAGTGAVLATPIAIDTLSPTIAVATDRTTLRAGETAVVTFTLSETSTTFNADDVAVSGGSLTGFQGSGREYSAVYVPALNFTGTGSLTPALAASTRASSSSRTAAPMALAKPCLSVK